MIQTNLSKDAPQVKTIIVTDDIEIVLDPSEIYPDDPGNGTPVMVYKTVGREKYSSTWNCANGTGTLEGREEIVDLTAYELRAMDEHAEEVDAWINAEYDRIEGKAK
jgi:hypothetical protein